MKRSPRAEAGSTKNKKDDHEASAPGLAAASAPASSPAPRTTTPAASPPIRRPVPQFGYALAWTLFLLPADGRRSR